MKLVKQVEDSTSINCLDLISSLPDELLGHVLSFLPVRCAVSTNFLSTRWRHLFTLMTCLSFDDEPWVFRLVENERIDACTKFKEFVDKVLELHRVSPIEKFSLGCGGTYDNSDLNRWVSTAVQKGVQELHYQFWNQIHYVPDILLVCETLVSVKIIGCGFNKVEIPLSLPKLKILHLESVVFFDFISVGKLLSSCDLLEKLTLRFCECETDGYTIHHAGTLKALTVQHCTFPLGTLEIDAPNLEYLTCGKNLGVKIVPSWEGSHAFVQAKLTFECTASDDSDYNEDSAEYDHERLQVKYDRQLLHAAAYKTVKLSFEMDSVMVLLTLNEGEKMPNFPCLSKLHFQSCPYKSWKYVTSLFDKSPQLKTVVFETGISCCHCSNNYCPYQYCFFDPQLPADEPLVPFDCRARAIEVRSFCGLDRSLLLLEDLLRNACNLKRLTVHVIISGQPYIEDLLETCKDLLMLPRASSDCCLQLIEQHEYSVSNINY